MKNIYMKLMLCILLVAMVFTGCTNASNAPATAPEQSAPSTETPAPQPSSGPKYKKEIVIAIADEFYNYRPYGNHFRIKINWYKLVFIPY